MPITISDIETMAPLKANSRVLGWGEWGNGYEVKGQVLAADDGEQLRIIQLKLKNAEAVKHEREYQIIVLDDQARIVGSFLGSTVSETREKMEDQLCAMGYFDKRGWSVVS
jgi:hypothetical protein